MSLRVSEGRILGDVCDTTDTDGDGLEQMSSFDAIDLPHSFIALCQASDAVDRICRHSDHVVPVETVAGRGHHLGPF